MRSWIDHQGLKSKCKRYAVALALATVAWSALGVQGQTARRSFEIRTRRMDVDVDGAPNAYGPPGAKALDRLHNARYRGRRNGEIVGYLTEDDNPGAPVVQGPGDPYPGYYISQTAFTDPRRTNPRDLLRYVDATKINYVVLGDVARRRGARDGDFVAVYSRKTGRSVFGISVPRRRRGLSGATGNCGAVLSGLELGPGIGAAVLSFSGGAGCGG